MADNIQTYTTRIFLNTEEAKKKLDELQSKVGCCNGYVGVGCQSAQRDRLS